MTIAAGSVHALLLAGQRPGPDALADHFGVALKVLVPLDGEPMLARVAHMLADHPAIGRVAILTADREVILADPGCAWLADHPRIAFAPAAATISRTVSDAMGEPSPDHPVLVTTGDHPLLETAMIDAFLAASAATDADLTVAVVERGRYEALLAEGRRTWLRFRGGAYSGANLFLLRTPAARRAVTFWQKVEADRKKGRKIVAAFGPLLLAAVGLKLLTLHRGLALAGRRLGVRVAAIEMDDPLVCIDVDKVEDHALATHLLQQRA
ncbi:nucleotidyltransferase family protein [Allosphingosinicella indica]|uniref:MobA-like NTP transferase domain-containing protein n=1 Tax=Allosphingosinicella indica TaxID=941907 RepID=A0A1X7G2B6_9SPHN|nr:nucleotidyltransferase family protein [Allosphingosinicella indica]SMF62580.1 MobA-like NTP transferase domain-containing protein [Allosphingosinicella indica]